MARAGYTGFIRRIGRNAAGNRDLSGGGVMNRTERKPEQKKYDLDEVAKKMFKELKGMKLTVAEVRTVTHKIRKESLNARI